LSSGEHEQREPRVVDPDVVADRRDVLEDDARIRSVEIEAPEALAVRVTCVSTRDAMS
jgi:hypothetical protein